MQKALPPDRVLFEGYPGTDSTMGGGRAILNFSHHPLWFVLVWRITNGI
jgi:hypothetical protein